MHDNDRPKHQRMRWLASAIAAAGAVLTLAGVAAPAALASNAGGGGSAGTSSAVDCTAGARLVSANYVVSKTNPDAKLAAVQLRYSPVCGAYYAQVFPRVHWSGYWFSAEVVSGDLKSRYQCHPTPPAGTDNGCTTAPMSRVAGRGYQAQGIMYKGSAKSVVAFGETPFMTSIGLPTGRSTNVDWAKLVLSDGGWPVSSNNVTVMLQWMNSEEPYNHWWNRDNPLNNGLGSGGGAGLGSYDNLVIAAHYVAQQLHSPNYGYPAVAKDLAASAAPSTTARAIEDSSWAASHYGHGSTWHSGSVPTVAAPSGEWS